MKSIRLVAGALIAGLVVLALVRLAASAAGVPMSNFTRDAVAVANMKWYTGSVSLLTCMVWAVGAALSFFVAWAAPAARRRMLSLGALTALLAADDALLFHDQIGPAHGVPEKLFGPTYALLALLVLGQLLRAGRSAAVGAFVLAIGLLGLSEAFDVVFHDVSFTVEDGAKLLGALVWATVPVLTYADAVRATRTPTPERAEAPSGPALTR